MSPTSKTRTLTFRDALRAVARHRILFVAIVALFVGVTHWTSRHARREYRSSALLVVEAPRRNLLDPANLIEVVQPDLPRYYQTQYELLGSERLVQDVLEAHPDLALALEASPEYSSEPPWWQAFLPEKEVEDDAQDRRLAFVQALRERIEVEPRDESYLVAVTFTGTDPELTTRFANALAERFAARHAQNDSANRETSAEYLTSKVRQLEAQWMTSRQALVDFQTEHEVLGFEERQRVLGADYERLVAARTQLDLEIAGEAPRLDGLRTGRHRGEEGELVPEAVALIGENEALVELRRELRTVEAGLQGKGGQALGAQHREILELTAKRDVLLASLRSAEDAFVRGRIARLDQRLRERESVLALAAQRKQELDELTGLRQRYEELATRSDDALSVYQQYARREAELAMAPVGAEQAPRWTANIYVEAPARVPSKPFKPRVLLNALLALLIGLATAFSTALLLEQWDDRVRTRADLEQVAGRRPIGLIGAFRKGRIAPDRVVLDDPSGVVAEAYRNVTASLLPAHGERGTQRAFVVTSAQPSEGKTTTAINLAAVLAADGRNVLLLEGDLRRPRLHRALELPAGPGLVDVFRGDATLDDALQATGRSGLTLLSCGDGRADHPSEILSGGWMHTFLEDLRARFDVVLVDTPPVNLVTDAFPLARLVDETVLVARSGQTRGRALAVALEKFAQLDLPLAGVVLNGVASRGEAGYGYGYGYGYAERHDDYTPRPPAPGGSPSPRAERPANGRSGRRSEVSV